MSKHVRPKNQSPRDVFWAKQPQCGPFGLLERAQLACEVTRRFGLCSEAQLVCYMLLQCANKDTGIVFPSYAELAKQVGASRRAVVDALRRAKERGIVDWYGTRGGSDNSNLYWFPLRYQLAAGVKPASPGVVQFDVVGGEAERRGVVKPASHEQGILNQVERTFLSEQGSEEKRHASNSRGRKGLPDGFPMSPENRQLAVELGHNPDAIHDSFCSSARGHGKTFADPDLAERSWIRGAHPPSKTKNSHARSALPPSSIEVPAGKVKVYDDSPQHYAWDRHHRQHGRPMIRSARYGYTLQDSEWPPGHDPSRLVGAHRVAEILPPIKKSG